MLINEIVTVNKYYIFAPAVINTCISGIRDPSILNMQDPKATVILGKLLGNITTPVCRAVIDYNTFKIPV